MDLISVGTLVVVSFGGRLPGTSNTPFAVDRPLSFFLHSLFMQPRADAVAWAKTRIVADALQAALPRARPLSVVILLGRERAEPSAARTESRPHSRSASGPVRCKRGASPSLPPALAPPRSRRLEQDRFPPRSSAH